jgi:hypothetical protein
MNDNTGGHQGPRRVCVEIGQAAACIPLAAAVWRDERDAGPTMVRAAAWAQGGGA